MDQTSQAARQVLRAFVSFPSPYTQTLILQALVAVCPEIAISLVPPTEDDLPDLQWADYDLLEFELPRANPSKYLTSSYVYRKALIRKHQLHRSILEYLAKCDYRQTPSILSEAWAEGWDVELRDAEELDELWIDDLYELAQALDANGSLDPQDRRWFILKPGFADRAQGIRLFSTKAELEAIFESFEDADSEEDEQDLLAKYRSITEAADATISGIADRTARNGDFDAKLEKWKRAIEDSSDEEDGTSPPTTGINGPSVTDSSSKLSPGAGTGREVPDTGNDRNSNDNDGDNDEDEDDGKLDTGVMTSQMRHFLIQEYVASPMLFDIAQRTHEPKPDPTGYKFHLRAYVLITGAYTVHLSRTMLALFSGSPYTHPTSTPDLSAHLTNTCLQTDAFGAPAPPEELIKLFWDLEGLTALRTEGEDYADLGAISREWLDQTFDIVGEVIGESVKAGAECGSFGLQFVPNAFEIFGVDLLLSIPPNFPTSQNGTLPVPKVTLLEYNASPDFHQSGMNLRPQLLEIFKGVVEISIKPFFNMDGDSQEGNRLADDAAGGNVDARDTHGWRLVGSREMPNM